jgi:hypothetical protein
MTPAAVERLAAAFWDRAGGKPPPPRDVEPHISFVTPVFFRAAHPVTPAAVRRWCERNGRPLPPTRDENRRLHGCAVAFRGFAAVMIDDALPPDLRRAIVAHELGHLLAEYLFPRERVVRRLGESVLPVLDGDRPPTDAERWAATLAGVRFGVHAHFLERSFDPATAHDDSERLANDMAFELLAPRAEVLAVPVGANPTNLTFARLLAERFGLPLSWAEGYAPRLNRAAERARPPSSRWGL